MVLDLVDIISNVGFPIGMCIYFVFKVEKSINNNTQALQEVKKVMNNCSRNQ